MWSRAVFVFHLLALDCIRPIYSPFLHLLCNQHSHRCISLVILWVWYSVGCFILCPGAAMHMRSPSPLLLHLPDVGDRAGLSLASTSHFHAMRVMSSGRPGAGVSDFSIRIIISSAFMGCDCGSGVDASLRLLLHLCDAGRSLRGTPSVLNFPIQCYPVYLAARLVHAVHYSEHASIYHQQVIFW